MKKFLLSFIVVVVFAGYIVYQRNPSLANVFSDDNHIILPPPGLSPTPTSSFTPASTPASTPAGQYKNGTYTSPVEDAFYGNVQIQMTVQNGRISNVSFLQYPNDRDTSRLINGQAMPYLIQEAIQAQNSNIDVISGATQTSEAFIQALKSLVRQAT